MEEFTKEAVSVYRNLSKIPTSTSARILKDGTHILSYWASKNVDTGKVSKVMSEYVLKNDFSVIHESPFAIDVGQELMSAISPSEKMRAVIKEAHGKHYLEVWKSKILLHSVNLTDIEKHGAVYTDSEFGSLSWNGDETKLVYVAEKEQPKKESFIKKTSPNDGILKSAVKGEEYVYQEDWGEEFCGKAFSVIVEFDLATEDITILTGLPTTCCPGQVLYSKDNDIIGVARETVPRRLGLLYCTNRPGFIFKLSSDGTYVRLSGKGQAVRSPRLSPDGATLVWLQRRAGGPHHGCLQLARCRMTDPLFRWDVIIDYVAHKKRIMTGEFYGIFSQSLPYRCFSKNSQYVVFSTPQRLQIKSFAVDIGKPDVIWELAKAEQGSTTVHDVHQDIIVASFSSLINSSTISVARLEEPSSFALIWKRLGDSCTQPRQDLQVEYITLEQTQSTDSIRDFYAVYVGKKVDDPGEKLPLIVWIHGGPHTAFADSFSTEAAFFNGLGFSIVLVNYRGSTGNGAAGVESLVSRIGSSDVSDCNMAVDKVIEMFQIDSKKVVLFGGSHGGFLVAHLSGQYPDKYAAVCARNPVTDIASMINGTDIPDWCVIETGQKFTEKGEMSEDLLLAMRRCSPIMHVHKVIAPTALMLGSADKRVPYNQGLDYYHHLKANGCKVKVFIYNDNHSLSLVEVHLDSMVNAALWFKQHTS